MTPDKARLFADYILGMPDKNSAAEYIRFSAFRLDDTFFEKFRGMIEEARGRNDDQRQQSLDWLMSVASDACGRAYAPFTAAAEARSSQKGVEGEPQTDYSHAMEVIQVDKRVTAMMMRAHFNPVDDALVDDWRNIVDDYRRLIETAPLKSPLNTTESLHLKLAQSLESLAGAYSFLNDRKEASASYEQAAKAFDDAGEPGGAARCRSRPGEDRIVEEAEYDDQIRLALQDLEKLDKSEPEYFSRLIDLGEIQANVEDDFAAEKTLLGAESGLLAANLGNPSGSNLAEALVATLKGFESGRDVTSAFNIQTSMLVRDLHCRIHMRLADIYRRLGDSKKADERLKLSEAMDYSSPDDDFSTTMLNKLADDWRKLSH